MKILLPSLCVLWLCGLAPAATVVMTPNPNATGGDLIRSTNYIGTLTSLASNSATAQIDFTWGTTHYEVTNLNANITLQLTNTTGLGGPKDVWVYLRSDGAARTVTVSTNGITTGTRISWGWNSITNGATAFTCTNRARLNLACVLAGEVSAAYEFQQ